MRLAAPAGQLRPLLRGLAWPICVVLLALSSANLPVLAAPAPEHKASTPGFKYYELQYELHRPTGECELAGELRPVSWSVIKDQQLVQLGELSNRAVDQPQERGDEVFRTSHELIWLKELELVRDGERAPDQVRNREVHSSLVSLYIRTDRAFASLLPLLIDVAEGRASAGDRQPSRPCRSWASSPDLGRPSSLIVQSKGTALAALGDGPEVPQGMELIPLRVSGRSARRVNLAFFGDGYKLDERDKFIADARRLADKIVDDGTFQSTAPLFNFWAVFVPSVESGVGSNGVPKDTPFGLYRDGHELRGLYAAHRKRARAACRAVRDGLFKDGGCDYAALIGNSDLYGGLGGEFTITTASRLNGALVLRHEIGHSLIDVGEEYEGGYAYFGGPFNSSPNFTDVTWAHWLTDPERTPRSEDAATPLQAYPWLDLEQAAWSTTFETEGRERYPQAMLRFSIAGLTSADQMLVKLDDEIVPWSIPHDWQGSVDRAWIEVPQPVQGGLSAGNHTLSFALNEEAFADASPRQRGVDEVVRQICSVEVSEYGQDDVFERQENFVGAFPTRSMYGTTSWRPTNEHCLMRMVATPRLCSVCQEGLWNQLVRRTGVIEGTFVSNNTGPRKTFGVELMPLAQFRKEPVKGLPRESYSVDWKFGGPDGVDRPDLANQTSLDLPDDEARGHWWVRVSLWSDEVRRWDQTHPSSQQTINQEETSIFI